MQPVIFRLAQRYIARRLFQSILFVIGVALGVAMVIAIDVANNSASRAFDLSTESITGRATHQITAGPAGIPTEFYRQLRVDLGLRLSAPVIEEFVRAPALGDQPLRLLGVDSFAEPPFRSYLNNVDIVGAEASSQAAFDALNAFIAEPNTVLISSTLAARFGIQPGDALTLQPKSQSQVVRVVGLLQPDSRVSEQALDNLLLADIATAQELAGLPGRLTRIDLILPPDFDIAAAQALLPAGAVIASVAAQNGALAQITAAFELNLQALSLLALIVGVFLIYNTVTFSVVQRRPVIGILRSLGATRGQIFLLILGEAFILGMIGTLLGLGLGVIFGRAAVSLVSRTITDIYFSVNVQSVVVAPITLGKGAVIGMAVSVFAALIPAFNATQTPPAGVLRRSDAEQSARRAVPAVTVGAIALAIGGLVLLQLPTQSIVLSFIGLFAIIIGGAFLTPLVLIVLMRVLTPVTYRLFGVLGGMAPRAVSRTLSRTSVAVAALTVAISVIVGVSVMISSFRNTVADWLETTLGADVYVSPPLANAQGTPVDVDPQIAAMLAAVAGVDRVTTVRSVNVTATDFPDQPPVNLAAVSAIIARSQRRFVWNHAPDADYWSALQAGQVVVSEAFAFRRAIDEDNNQITLLTDAGPQTFTVAGVYYDYSTDQGVMLMADDVYRRYYDDPFISSLALFVESPEQLGPVMDDLRTSALSGLDLQTQSYTDLRDSVFEVFDRAFSITLALRLLATLVAFIGILSALLALQLEHTREYGVLRAVGMTPRQLWRFTLLQTGLMGMTAGILALPLGFIMALVLIFVINVRSFGWTMQLILSPQEFVQAFAVAVLAALLAGVYPAWRLGRLVTARALRHE